MTTWTKTLAGFSSVQLKTHFLQIYIKTKVFLYIWNWVTAVWSLTDPLPAPSVSLSLVPVLLDPLSPGPGLAVVLRSSFCPVSLHMTDAELSPHSFLCYVTSAQTAGRLSDDEEGRTLLFLTPGHLWRHCSDTTAASSPRLHRMKRQRNIKHKIHKKMYFLFIGSFECSTNLCTESIDSKFSVFRINTQTMMSQHISSAEINLFVSFLSHISRRTRHN